MYKHTQYVLYNTGGWSYDENSIFIISIDKNFEKYLRTPKSTSLCNSRPSISPI